MTYLFADGGFETQRHGGTKTPGYKYFIPFLLRASVSWCLRGSKQYKKLNRINQYIKCAISLILLFPLL